MKTKGWRKIFSFTFIQYIKTKSFVVGTAIICLITAVICVLTNVLPKAMMKDVVSSEDTGDDSSDISEFLNSGKLYLFDEANILTEDDTKTLSDKFSDRFSKPEKSLENIVEELKDSEALEIAVQITASADKDGKVIGYDVRAYYAPNAKGSADMTNEIMSELVNRRIMLNAGVAPEKYEETKISVATYKTEAGGKNLNSIQGMVNYVLPLLISIVLFMFIFSYGSVVAQSIATEKTSRVMELLLTSVRPLAVVIGKVLAMGLVSFLQFFLVIGVGAGSFALSAPFGWMGIATDLLKNPQIQSALNQATQSGGAVGNVPAGVSSADFEMAQTMNEFTKVFTPVNILTIILIFILGFLFFALIAALIGASVSRMEDLQAAMSPYSIIGVLGMYLAYFPVVSNSEALASGDSSMNPVQVFSYFFPISSPFSLPSAVLLGTLEPWKIAVGIGVLAVFVVLIAIVVSKVYEAIILHNGNRIKFGDILKMAVRK